MTRNFTEWQNWILQNLQLLSKRYGKNNVILNAKDWQSIYILNFVLPKNWQKTTTPLLMILPEKSKIFYTPPDRFYFSKGLKTINGKRPKHYFEDDFFNDMSERNLARFSFHLKKGWNPRANCLKGTNLLQVIDGLYKGMEFGAQEAMKCNK